MRILAGQYFDSETGLHYNWHRYYDPKIGRYITVDPIGIVRGRVPSTILPKYSTTRWMNDILLRGLNQPYAYVNNNPLRWIDPTGLAPEDDANNDGSDYSRYMICPQSWFVGKVCEACIDFGCKISMTFCCTIEEQACLATVAGDQEKENACRNKFIQCLGGVKKPKLPKGQGPGDI